MQGESTRQATTALELCLRSLCDGDRFNVCRFGSSHEMLSPMSLPYSAATLAKALRFIGRDANLGGTEIYRPLQEILSLAPSVGGIRNIVLLTDGQVSNEPAVIELARKWSAKNRLFTFGIGAAASGFLVRGLARVTRGAAEFIAGDERIEDKVLRTFSRITSPQVSDAVIKWGDLDVQTPAEIPAVFDGDMLRVFARAPGQLPESVNLECTTPTGRCSWTLAVSAPTHDGGVIARSWARTMIQSWEDADEPANKSPARRESSASRRLAAISKQFGILCSRTSFICVEHRTLEERNAGLPELRRVPVKLAAGWGNVAGETVCCDVRASAAPACASGPMIRELTDGCIDFLETKGGLGSAAPPRQRIQINSADDGTLNKLRKLFRPIAEKTDSAMARATPLQRPAQPSSKEATERGDFLLSLLGLQAAEGWFDERAGEALRIAGHDVAELEAEVVSRLALRLDEKRDDHRRRILMTALVLAALPRWFADREAVWRRAARKARRLVSQATKLDMGEVERLLV
jgi:Ca-activated chloride channel family protein